MFERLKEFRWYIVATIAAAPYLITVLSIMVAFANDPKFFAELFTEILTRENVDRVTNGLTVVDWLCEADPACVLEFPKP